RGRHCEPLAACVDKRARKLGGAPHLPRDMRGETRLVGFAALTLQITFSRKLSAMKRDGHAVAREGRNDRSLIAETPKSAAFARDMPIGQPRNGKRLFEKAFCAKKALAKMRTGSLYGFDEPFPAAIVPREGGFADQKAKVGAASFDRLQTRIAAGEENELH